MPWEVMPDLFFYRDREAIEKEENERAENEQVIKSGDYFAAPGEARTVAAAPVAPVSGYHVTEDWAASTETTNGAAASSEQAAPTGEAPTSGDHPLDLSSSRQTPGGLASYVNLSLDTYLN